MIKVIYIEQPRPGKTREFWARRWRVHAGFAMLFAEFWDPIQLYIQNDCIADASAFAGVDTSFGGVGELFYTDIDSCKASLATPNMPAILDDGSQVFARQRAVHLITKVKNLIGSRPAGVRVFAYATRPANMARDEFQLSLEDSFRASSSVFVESPVNMTIAHSIEDRDTHESVIDFSFHTVEAATAGHAAWTEYVEQDDFLKVALLRDPLKVVTHSHILYDKDNFGTG
ncbi:MAG: hypothetical protein R3E21_08350 [Caenibius sp.]